MKWFASAVALSGFVALVSCGSGGSENVDPGPAPMVVSTELASHEPVWTDVKGIPMLIGTADIIWENDDPSDGWENDLTDDDYSQTHGSARVGHASGAKGTPVTRVIQFLKLEAPQSGNVPVHVLRWDTPPTVRMDKDATPEDRREILTAVQMINSALPPDWQLTILDTGADVTAGRDGYIDVFFKPSNEWPSWARQPNVLGVRGGQLDRSGREYEGAEIYLNNTHDDLRTREQRTHTLLHEMLHALGRSHVSSDDFSDTVLHTSPTTGLLNWLYLSPIDDATLRAVHHFLDVGQRREDETSGDGTGLRAENFGTWNTDSFHVFGELPHTESQNLLFGAIWKYGQARPYVIGMDPAPALTETEGRARWSGRLLGLTPDVKTVGGAMNMMIRFGTTVKGDLDFTDMREWDAEAGPGTIDTGVQWTGGNTDGELHYGIEIREGLLFTETDDTRNDEGWITGQFFGADHEGAAGTLRRPDLSAGFAGQKIQ